MDKKPLIAAIVARVGTLILVTGVILFVAAGSSSYWQAWLLCAIFFVTSMAISFYFLIVDPAFLERRTKHREKEQEQRTVRKVMGLAMLTGLVLAGLDFRFHGSAMPLSFVFTGDALIVIGFFAVFLVFNQNRFAASTIEVEQGQKVVSTGTYGIVRHPMYLGSLIVFLGIPLALGSWWSALGFFTATAMLIPRIQNEEEVLLRDLPGYGDYCRKVRWRILPGVW